MKKILIIVVGLLFISLNVFADDVSIDSDGNVKTGVSNTDANLEVTGASGEHGMVGSTSGNDAAGVYGINTTNNNYGILGYDQYGVYGSSATGYAGYFEGNVYVTGELGASTLNITETDPVFSGSAASGITSGQVTNWNSTYEWGNHATAGYLKAETDPVFTGSAAFGVTAGQVTNWDTAFSWGDHATEGYDTTNDAWVGTGDVYTTSGKVGIGVASPVSKVDVKTQLNSANAGALNLPLRVNGAEVIGQGPGIGFLASSNDGNVGAKIVHIREGNQSQGGLAFYTKPDTTEGDTTTEKLRILANGNVGIGTSSPDYKLEVSGTADTYLGYFHNDSSSLPSYGIYASGDASDANGANGYGGTFYAYGGSILGNAFGTRSYAYANGSSIAYGVYSDATGGTTSGKEWAFYGLGDGYFSGKVGIGTISPDYKLEISGGTNTYLGYFNNDNNSTGSAYGIYATGDARGTGTGYGYGGTFYAYGGSTMGIPYGIRSYAYAYGSSRAYGVYVDATGGTTSGEEWAFFGYGDGYFSGNVGIGSTTPTQKLYVSGNIYATGSITPGSSRELKENIRELSAEEALSTIDSLSPQKFYYKADSEDEHVGFIAEDVPELVATKDRKGVSSMDVVAVLTKVVQEQQKTIAELNERLKELEKEVKLKETLASVIK